PTQPVTCLARYQLMSHTSVLEEQRRRGGAQRWNDFVKRYPAATIDPATHHPVEVVADPRLGDAPLLWFPPDFSDPVVDATLFGDLQIVDATRLGVGDRAELGTLTERGRARLRGRALVEFLLESGAIQAFMHVGATLCLLAEVEDVRGYRAELGGEHEYYTNEENHDPLWFAVEIAADGRMLVTGIEPRGSIPDKP